MRRWRVIARAKDFFSRSCSSEAPSTHTAQTPSREAYRESWAHASPARAGQQNQWGTAGVAATGALAVLGCQELCKRTPSFELPFPWKGIAKEPKANEAAGSFPPPAISAAPTVLGPQFIADAAAMAAPAVVNITVTKDGLPVPQDHSGTGFIYNSNGCILTNAHVIADALPRSEYIGSENRNATSCSNDRTSSSSRASTSNSSSRKPITVALQDGRIFQGSVLMFDRISDLAVIQISSSQPLPVAKLGTSKGLRAGEWVLALGSPLHLQNSVTAGIISCVDRKAADLGLPRVRTEYIQTDAAINRGNSGGPLVNLQGEVIGLACFKAISADGVSFAIPIDTAKDVIHELQLKGRVIRPYIGIKMLQLNEHNAAQMRQKDPNFPVIAQGILVPYVASGSPACKSGLREGDIITGFAGQSSNLSTNHLIQCLSQNVRKSMEVTVLRPGSGSMILQVNVSEALQ